MAKDLDWALIEVLRRIDAGATYFKAADASNQAMQDFQPLACAVIEASRLGQIDKIMPITESLGGSLAYSEVIIIGGLTHRGRQLLQEARGQLTPSDHALEDVFNQLPDQHLRLQWGKALSRRQTDPSGAITAARSFLESTQKWILEQGYKTVSDRKKLFSATLEEIGLTDHGAPMPDLLQHLDKLLVAIGKVRNEHGDAHGPSDGSTILTSAEAALCVNIAGSIGLYLLDSHLSKRK